MIICDWFTCFTYPSSCWSFLWYAWLLDSKMVLLNPLAFIQDTMLFRNCLIFVYNTNTQSEAYNSQEVKLRQASVTGKTKKKRWDEPLCEPEGWAPLSGAQRVSYFWKSILDKRKQDVLVKLLLLFCRCQIQQCFVFKINCQLKHYLPR